MKAWLSWAIVIVCVGLGTWYYTRNDVRAARHCRPTRAPEPAPRPKESPSRRNDAQDTVSAKAAKKARKLAKRAAAPVDKDKEGDMSASSAAGVEADDFSPAQSPPFTAAVTMMPSGRDVSDMLEPQAPPPTVLRMAAIPPSQRPKGERAESPKKSKKQRQNRKKAELAKLQREKDEQERQVLLEKQRRTAREARGEPAKNGLQSANAAANPWRKPDASANVAGPLLDTFDPDAVSTTSSSGNATGTSATDSLTNSMHWNNMPPEEEQMRMAMEESEWTTVPKGKKGRKPKTDTPDTTSEESSEAGRQDTPVKTAAAPAAEHKAHDKAAPQPAINLLPTQGGHPMDSDWPVV